jgi:hypothetical protein
MIDWFLEKYVYGFSFSIFIFLFLIGLFILLKNKLGRYYTK